MSPLRYKVVVDDYYNPTRDPTPEELELIRTYVGMYVKERGVEPMCDHEVPGVSGLVLFQHIHN